MEEHEKPEAGKTPPKKDSPRRRKSIAVSSFVAAGLAQGYIGAHPELIPQAVEVDKVPLVATADLGEELVVQNPRIEPMPGMGAEGRDGVLFTHVGAGGEIVDVQFDRARITPTSLTVLSGNARLPASLRTYGPVHYYVRGSARELTGSRAFLSVRSDGPLPKELRISQTMPPGDMAYRSFTLRAPDAALDVRLQVRPPAPNPEDINAAAAGIPNDVIGLDVGGWHHTSPGLVPIDVVADPGSKMTVTFTPAATAPLWQTGDALYNPFNESSLSVQASSIGIMQGSSPVMSLSVTHWMGQRSELILNSLRVGSDRLAASAEGFAVVYPPGENSPSLIERIEKQPLLAMLLGALNVALFGWIRREFFPKSVEAEAEREIAEELEEKEKKKKEEEELSRAEHEREEREREAEREHEVEVEQEREREAVMREHEHGVAVEATEKHEHPEPAQTDIDAPVDADHEHEQMQIPTG
jgi:hypothetical protein